MTTAQLVKSLRRTAPDLATAAGPSGAPGVGRRRLHSHVPGKDWLRDVILGGQDGLVNILGIILGVMAGGGSSPVLLSAGFAAAITESLSMGAVGYTSVSADRDFYAAQKALEEAAVDNDVDLERREVTEPFHTAGA